MEASGAGIGRLDCYEDMFKEITRKLYGEDPDHRTSSVQNEFETSYKNDEDTGNGTDGGASSDDGKWHLDEEPLEGTDGSRIAAYRAATCTWRCYECGDCMGGGPRDVAEHFVELHSSRLLAEETARRLSGRGKDYHLGPADMKLEEVVNYLERVRDRAERSAPPTRRTQETQTIPAALLPVTSSFLLQELPSTPPQHLHQVQQNPGIASMPVTTATALATAVSVAAATGNTGGGGGGGGGGSGNGHASGKRYTCLYCPYGTDRRDLYTRHENIHREEKPFHCYVCYKPFSRADHVKKHFLRMHREHTYELARIRRPVSSTSILSSTPKQQQQQQQQQPSPAIAPVTESSSNNSSSTTSSSGGIPAATYAAVYASPKPAQIVQHPPIATTYQLQTPASAALYQAASLTSAIAAAAANASNIMQQQHHQQQQQTEVNCNRRLQNGACGKGGLKGGSSSGGGSSASAKANQERRYTCCYCSWSGVDNWCLKRHLNTHLKPFACALCEYKAARAERLSTHVLKVHNRRQCSRCSFLAEDLAQLQVHQLHVHRVSNASVAAAAAAAAAVAAQSSGQGQNERQQPQQPQAIHPLGGGRAPLPGPSVFPAIASATTLIPPTTILGDWSSEVAAAVAYGNYWQESSWCEERFLQSEAGRRSRKQRMPRKITPTEEMDGPQDLSLKAFEYHDNDELLEPAVMESPTSLPDRTKKQQGISKLRCLRCPRDAVARNFGYHTRCSLLLHKLWRHARRSTRKTMTKGKRRLSRTMQLQRKATSITLKATVYTQRAFDAYQR